MKRCFNIFLLLLFLLNNSSVFAASCKHSSKIEECNSELQSYLKNDGTFIAPGTSLRHIEDFTCLQDVPEKRVLQIAMEENFKEIDEEMDEYLKTLSEAKDLYFGEESEYTYMEGLNHIWQKTNYFKGKFYDACTEALVDAGDCVEYIAYTNPQDRPSLSVEGSKEYLKGSGGDCFGLSDVKSSIFNQVGYNLMLLNKQQVDRDEKKLYDQEIRTKYDKIVDLMMINIGYLERIWKGWPSKIRNAL